MTSGILPYSVQLGVQNYTRTHREYKELSIRVDDLISKVPPKIGPIVARLM